MQYSKIFFEARTVKSVRHLQISFEGESRDNMGKWNSSGQLAEVLKVDDHIVLVSPFNQRPFMVAHTLQELEQRIFEKYGIELTGHEVFTNKAKVK